MKETSSLMLQSALENGRMFNTGNEALSAIDKIALPRVLKIVEECADPEIALKAVDRLTEWAQWMRPQNGGAKDKGSQVPFMINIDLSGKQGKPVVIDAKAEDAK